MVFIFRLCLLCVIWRKLCWVWKKNNTKLVFLL